MSYEFIIIGITILMGFVASILFEKTRISQVIVLMFFGFLLGPVLGIMDVSPTSVIVSILPFIATLALIILLFDGGMEFDIFTMAKAIPKSMLFTLVVFIVSIILVTVFCIYGLGWPLTHGALLGAVIGGISSAVVITMVEKTGVKNETKSLLTVEATMTDALCIITAVLLIEIIIAGGEVPSFDVVANTLLSQFTIAILFGLLAAIFWIGITEKFSMLNYGYMLMLATVFILFAITQSVKGNGGIAVFVFGLLLGNARKLGKMTRIELENPISRMMKSFQEEVTFFVRTFFFVYIGLLLSIDHFSFDIIIVSLGLVGILAIARFIVQKTVLGSMLKRDGNVTMAMMPRGLAAAVLATLPITSGIIIANFQELVLGVLLFSNIAATIGVFILDKEDKNCENVKPISKSAKNAKPKKTKE
ncbi:cation:proton antiporter [Candidatus Micrarchaeota archaeon]|nr:cation:proton antiporter [Candidatus Micrarchaeota archaeon]MBU1166086.1 cation:proton antiporter [Candidatus Micrarchaeota archaeon]MBU1886666.1 cation:proton antiporter [Candidatus Micrarchaeota archaeon]